MEFNELARKHNDWRNAQAYRDATVLEHLALLASEVGEVVNECRGDTDDFSIAARLELADVVLRAMGIADAFGFDLEQAIKDKIEINKARGNNNRKV